ncbi:hypothetical protein [Brevibacillus laterosporus]|uniref:BclA C-terminal domain-containing protein n=1 Tax=Brevibacillus laterosporus TaxID=1465 RepID=UPI003557FA78
MVGGTLIPFPDAQDIGPGITVNATNDTFTVAAAGNYLIAYSINITLSLLVSSRILVNGVPVAGSVVSPLVGLTSFEAQVIVPVPAGGNIQVQLFGVAALATLAATIPTSITIIRLS